MPNDPLRDAEAAAREEVVAAARSFGGPNRGPSGRHSLERTQNALDAYRDAIEARVRRGRDAEGLQGGTTMTARIDVITELDRARAKFPKFNSAHEGFAVLLEEVEELKREVFWGPTHGAGPRRRTDLMRAEAVQVAAMALRFIEDVCDA